MNHVRFELLVCHSSFDGMMQGVVGLGVSKLVQSIVWS